MSVKKYLTLSGLTYFLNKIKTYLTSSTYLNSIGIIPNNDNSVDLGASSKNIKMIYTKRITINGTQFLPSDYATLSGLATVATSGSYNDLSNKPTIPTVNDATLTIQQNGTTVNSFSANSSSNKTVNIQCVDLSTAQTISGTKTFSASPRVTKTFPDIALNISDCDVTEIPTEAKFASLFFRDKNTKNLAYITGQQRTSGQKRMCLRTHRTDNIDSYYSVDLDSDGDFYPEQNNSLRLGTPALQWNNAYTRNILIDNDINIASSLINKTSTSGVISIRGGLNTQDGASIGLYGKDYNGAIAGNIYMTAYGNSDYTTFRIYPNGVISVTNNSTATTKNVAMQEDVVNLTTPQTIGGVKTFTSNMVIQGSKKVTCNLDNSFIELDGGTTWGKGGSIVLSGQDRGSYNNSVLIVSKSDSNTDILQYQNGELKPLSNNTNNSSLGTSTNKWSKIYSDDVVHTTGNETISGVKTFSNDIRVDKATPRLQMKSTEYSSETSSAMTISDIALLNNSGGFSAWIVHQLRDDLTKRLCFRVWPHASNTYRGFVFDDSCNLYPENSNSALGTSTNKWKSFNGINPGALSLPGDTYIEIDTTNYAWGNNFTFTPDYDGYCFINIGSSTNSKKISLKTGRGEYYFSNQTEIFRFTFPVYKEKLVTILTNSSGTESVIPTIRLFPCQGNV